MAERAPSKSASKARPAAGILARALAWLVFGSMGIFAAASLAADRPSTRGAEQASDRTNDHQSALTPRERADAIVASLEDADGSELAEIERRLAELGREAMIPLKLAELSGNLVVRRRAETLAKRLRWRLAVSDTLLKRQPKLIDVMAGADRQARTGKVDALVSSAAAMHIGFFVECLADPEPYVRQRAVQGLVAVAQRGGSGAVRARERLVELLGSTRDEQLRLSLLGVLHELDHWPLEKIRPLLAEGSIEVRRTALLTLGHSQMPAAIEPVAAQLDDPDWRIRAAALDALSDLARDPNEKRIAAKVLSVVDDPDEFVSSRALKLLVQLEHPEAGDVLLERLQQKKIDRNTALPLLAELGHARAWPMLKEQFDQAGNAERRNEVLAMMTPIADDRRVLRFAKDILANENQRDLWITSIDLLTRGHDYDTPLLPVLGDKLLDGDRAVAHATWQQMRWRITREPLPAKLADALERSDSPARRGWLLLAKAWSRASDAPATALRLTSDPADEVAALAISVLSQERGFASLGDPDLDRYRSPEIARSTRPGHGVDDARLRAAVESVMRDASRPLARTRAASLLRLAAGPSEEGDAVLRAALRGREVELKVAALAGLSRSPGDLADDLNIDALLAEPRTRHYTAGMLAARGRDGDLAKVAGVLEHIRDMDHATRVLPALIAAGGDAADAAFAFIKRQDSEWRRSSALASLRGVAGPEVVAFVKRVLAAGLIQDHYYQQASRVAMSLPHPDAAELLQWMLDHAPDRAWLDRSAMVSRLLEHDAGGSGALLMSQLRRGDDQSVGAALQALENIEPTPELVDAFIEAATTEPRLSGRAAEAVVRWLSVEAVRARLLPAFDAIDPETALAVLDRFGSIATTDDLPILLSIDDAQPGVRGRTSSIVARLLRDEPLDIAAYPPSQRGGLLLASGHRPDARRLVQPYLAFDHPSTRRGAVEALAIWLAARASHDIEPLREAERRVLLAAVRSEDAGLAYLAAEALYAVDRDALAAVAFDDITALEAKLRRLAAGSGWPAAGDALVRRGTQPRSRDTTMRLAAAAALEHERWDLLAATAGGRSMYTLHDLLHDAALASRDPRLVEALLSWDLIGHSVSDRDLLRGIVKTQRERPTRLLASVFHQRTPRDPEPGDLPAFLESLRFQPAHEIDPGRTLATALRLASAAERSSIEDQADRAGLAAGVARAVLAVAWDDDKARSSLLDTVRAAMRRSGMHGQTPPDVALALAALSLIGDADVAAAIVRAAGDPDPDDWQRRMTRGVLLATAAGIAPHAAADALAGQTFHVYRPHTPGAEVSAAQLRADAAVMTEGWSPPPVAPEVSAWHRTLAHAASGEAGAIRTLTNLHASARYEASSHRYGQSGVEPVGVEPLEQRVTRWVRGKAAGEKSDSTQTHGQTGVSTNGYSGDATGVFPSQTQEMQRFNEMALAADFVRVAVNESGLGRLADALRTLLRAEDPTVAGRALRIVQVGRMRWLADAVKPLLDREPALAYQAAEVLAMLRGPAAAPALRSRLEAADHFEPRAVYGGLLALIGEPEPGLRREIEARWLSRRLRARLLTLTPPRRAAGGGLLGVFFGGSRNREPETPHRDAWRGDGQLSHPPAWASLLARFPRPEAGRRMALYPMSHLADPTHPVPLAAARAMPNEARAEAEASSDAASPPISWGVSTHGVFVVPAMDAGLVPTEADRFEMASQPLLLRLHAFERWLEPWFFVQFAAEAQSPAELRDRWREWWRANAASSPDAWWRQALRQAVGELEDSRWWVRLQALGRLERLTGRTSDLASPWDEPAWRANVVNPWKTWLRSDAAERPLAALRASVKASPLPRGFELHAAAADESTAAADLADLVTLAGWGDARQHAAAMAQLARWPDREALHKQALRWQHSPRTDLQQWIASRAQVRAAEPRLVYHASDLHPEAGPAAP